MAFTLLEEEKKNKFTLLKEELNKFTLKQEEPIDSKFTLLQPEGTKTEQTGYSDIDYSTQELARQLQSGTYTPQYDTRPDLSLKDVGKATVKGFESGAMLGYTPLFDEYVPDTTLEKGLYFSSQLAGFILPMTLTTKLVTTGFGGMMRLAPALSKIPVGVRIVGLATTTGAILGGIQKPEEGETRIQGALRSGITFGALTGVGLAGQKILAKRGIAKLNKMLDKSDELQEVLGVDMALDKKTVLENPQIAGILKGLKGGDKSVVLNIVKGRQGLPIELRQGWYEKHIGSPIYNKLVDSLNKWNWGPANYIKSKFVYRYGQPKEWAESAEDRLLQVALGKDKAGAIGQLLSSKLNEAEATNIVNALGRTEPGLVEKLMRDKPLSSAEQMRVMQIMRGSITAGARPDLATRATIAREEIDNLSKELVSLPIPEETKQIITNNMGTYVRRLYTTKEGKGIFSKIFAPLRLKGRSTFLKERASVVKEAFRKDILKEQNIVAKGLKSLTINKIEGVGGVTQARLANSGFRTIANLEGATIEDLMKVPNMTEKAANKILIQAKTMGHNIRALQSRAQFLNFRLTKDITRVDFSSDVRKTLGEITEAGYPTVRTINSLVNDIETSKLFDFASTNANIATADYNIAMAKGWEKLPDLPSLGRLKGMFVPPSVAGDIQYMQNIANESESLYLKMLSMWKFSKVPLNPATHCRNIFSNIMLLDASGTPLTRQPSVVSMALEEFQTKGRFYQMAKETGGIGGEFSDVDISKMLNNWNATSGSMMERAIEFSGKTLGFKDMAKLYQAEEQVFKLAKFIDMIGYQGATPEMAAAEAQKWLFNYSKIPSAINTIKNAWWGSPFITFQYKVMPRMVESVIKNPLTLAKYPMVFTGIEQYMINKYNLTDKEVAMAKKRDPWTLIGSPLANFKFITSVKINSNGKKDINVTDMGFTFPFGEVGEVGAFGNIMGFMNGPVPKIAPIIAPLITGQPYVEPTFGRELKTRMDKLDYIAEQFMPPLAGYSGDRIIAAAEGRTDYYGVPYDYWQEVMRNVFGIKTTTSVSDVATYKLYREMEGQRRDIMIEINAIGKNHSLTPEEKQKKIQNEIKLYKKNTDNIMKMNKL